MFNIFGKNDWYPVWSDIGEWEYKSISTHIPLRKTRCFFEILFSPSRKEYRLKIGGDKPKESSVYQISVQKLNEFIKNGHE